MEKKPEVKKVEKTHRTGDKSFKMHIGRDSNMVTGITTVIIIEAFYIKEKT